MKFYRVIQAGFLLGALALMNGCHGESRLTYVNQTTQETLELFPQRSLKNAAISTFHGVRLGRYNLGRPDQDVVTGQFVWKEDTVNLQPMNSCAHSESIDAECPPENDARVLKFAEDGSLRDTAGNIWKPAVVKSIEVKMYPMGGSEISADVQSGSGSNP